MEEYFAALSRAFADYRQDIEDFEHKSKPTDGLFGFGRSLQNDACNDRFDKHVEQAVTDLVSAGPSPEDAERAIRMILSQDTRAWPLAAQWMLRAVERHCIPLTPFLTPAAAATLQKEYAGRYRPWDRLPAQKQLLQALNKAQSDKG